MPLEGKSFFFGGGGLCIKKEYVDPNNYIIGSQKDVVLVSFCFRLSASVKNHLK